MNSPFSLPLLGLATSLIYPCPYYECERIWSRRSRARMSWGLRLIWLLSGSGCDRMSWVSTHEWVDSLTHHVGYPLCSISSPSAPAVLPFNPAARLALGDGVPLFSFQERRQRDLHWRRTTQSLLPLFLRLCLLPSSCLSPICCRLSFPCCSQRHPLLRHDVLPIDSRTPVTELMADALGSLAEQKSPNIKVMVIPSFFGWMHTSIRFSSRSLLRVL